MSSGHSAGLRSTSQFRNAEASLQEKRLKEAKKIAQQDGGRSNELCIATSMAEHQQTIHPGAKRPKKDESKLRRKNNWIGKRVELRSRQRRK
mmetsp:Transcript_41778/g.61143  ORF Transcript_41778/g.61143 Transcript_41778/m.61143 type:complete len:92 (-) Transcript_41778:1567-1842(-)